MREISMRVYREKGVLHVLVDGTKDPKVARQHAEASLAIRPQPNGWDTAVGTDSVDFTPKK